MRGLYLDVSTPRLSRLHVNGNRHRNPSKHRTSPPPPPPLAPLHTPHIAASSSPPAPHLMSTPLTTTPARLARRLAAAARLQVLSRPISSHQPKQADPQRQQITLSRGGEKKWADLSPTQKAGRTASTGANLLTIVIGMGLTVCSPSTMHHQPTNQTANIDS